MARWLGIESPKSISETKKEILPKLETKSSNSLNNSLSESISTESTPLNGISNCETAICQPSMPPKLEAYSVKVLESKVDLALKQQEKCSEFESTEPKVIKVVEAKGVQKTEVEESWQPDLSGWGVFKGLSK